MKYIKCNNCGTKIPLGARVVSHRMYCGIYCSDKCFLIAAAIARRKKKAMVYIMDENQLPGRPSTQYVKTILQGYVDNDMDISVLEKSLEVNSIECA